MTTTPTPPTEPGTDPYPGGIPEPGPDLPDPFPDNPPEPLPGEQPPPPLPPGGPQVERERCHQICDGQASITMGRPASVVRRKASSSMTPSWNQTALAPILTASSAN